jgi:hypothetical protein
MKPPRHFQIKYINCSSALNKHAKFQSSLHLVYGFFYSNMHQKITRVALTFILSHFALDHVLQVNIAVKILSLDPIQPTNVRGKIINKQETIAADNTGSIKLTLGKSC